MFVVQLSWSASMSGCSSVAYGGGFTWNCGIRLHSARLVCNSFGRWSCFPSYTQRYQHQQCVQRDGHSTSSGLFPSFANCCGSRLALIRFAQSFRPLFRLHRQPQELNNQVLQLCPVVVAGHPRLHHQRNHSSRCFLRSFR